LREEVSSHLKTCHREGYSSAGSGGEMKKEKNGTKKKADNVGFLEDEPRVVREKA